MKTRFFLTLASCLTLLSMSTRSQAQGPGDGAPVDPEPRLSFQFDELMRFGLTVLKDAAGRPVNKRLTFSANGGTNSTVVKIDGKDIQFGGPEGKWVEKDVKIPRGSRSVWAVGHVHISQILEIVPSTQPVEVSPGVRKRLLDTCLIRYLIENKDSQHHTVGLRIQVDTLIGGNDGVPFAVPTMQGLVNTLKDFTAPGDVPEFVQALEVPNLLAPGTVGHMTLKVGGNVEPPSRVSLTRWPGFSFTRWEVPMVHMGSDSAVVIYWNADRALNANDSRNLGFAYGLGRVSSGEGTGKLALTVNGTFIAGEPFTVTAYVQNPTPNQTLTLELPPGLQRAEGNATESVPPPSKESKNTSILTWKVKAPQPGQYTVKVSSNTGISQTQPVTILPNRRPMPEGGKLLGLTLSGPLALNQVFTATATVKNPVPDQHLTLTTLPPGLERVEGADRQPVPSVAAGHDAESTVAWRIKAVSPGNFTLRVESSTGGMALKDLAIKSAATPVVGKLLALSLSGPLKLNQIFTLTAKVKNPLPDQHLSLTPPAGLVRTDGDERQLVPAVPGGHDGESSVVWKIKAEKVGTFRLDVHSSTGEMQSKSVTIANQKSEFDLLDARDALKMSVKNLEENLILDVDSDGRVTSLDAAMILQRVLDRAHKGP